LFFFLQFSSLLKQFKFSEYFVLSWLYRGEKIFREPNRDWLALPWIVKENACLQDFAFLFLFIDEYFQLLILEEPFLFQTQAHGVHTEGDVVYVPFPLDCKYGE